MIGVHDPASMAADRHVLSRTAYPGILLVSSSLHVLYMNPEARTLLSRLTLPDPAPTPAWHLPAMVRSFCQDLFESLPPTPRPLDWEPLHLARISDTPTSSILLRGFDVPDPHMEESGRLLLLLEAVQPISKAPHAARSKPPIRLTPREESVVRYLTEGLTNKEIAHRLNLSEHTVKDHVKRLMKKTRVTTRTAVVSRLLSQRDMTSMARSTVFSTMDSEIHDLAV